MKQQHTVSFTVAATFSSIYCFWLFLYISLHSFHLITSQYISINTQPVPENVKILNYFPCPEEFWTEYIIASKPVLFHRSLQLLPAFALWNDNYLRLNYGHMEVVVETQRKENRTAKPISILFSDFLRSYQTEDLYMITVADSEWLADVSMPKSLQCGNLQKAFSHINIWMSNGGTRSVLHRDAYDNIHCMIDGYKEIILINKTLEGKIHVNQDGYSDIDLEWNNVLNAPWLELPWYNLTIKSGDCIFIPYMWFHQVRSSNSRTLSLNWWLNHLLWFNASDCEDKQLEDWIPSDRFHFPTLAQKEHFQLVQTVGDKHNFTQEEFLNSFEGVACENMELQQFFMFLDQNGNNIVTLQEMYSVDSVSFTSYFVNCGFNHDEL